VVRAADDVFAATVIVTALLPAPLAGDSLTHPATEDAVQEQPAGALTVTTADPPSAGTDTEDVDTA
jgi:hypothetical protein